MDWQRYAVIAAIFYEKKLCNDRSMSANLTAEQIREILQKAGNHPSDPRLAASLVEAAVLLPLIQEGGMWQVLYIRRSNHLKAHQGQVAFPGGMRDPGDASLEETALRETYEEIGVPPQAVKILGRLGQVPTPSGFLITPVVGVLIPPYTLTLQPEEVDRAFTIPLDWLMQPGHRQERTIILNNRRVEGVVFFDEYDGELLWGVTGRITVNFIGMLSKEQI